MTSSIFEQWLRKWDNELTRKARKIILFIDNCAAHPHVGGLQSIELAYLPPNTTSEIQPCDQGIINTLKAYYRKKMIRLLVQFIDGGQAMPNFKITLLSAMQMIRAAWDSLTPSTIANCFRKAGFTDLGNEDSTCTEQDEQPVTLDGLRLEEPVTFEEYVNCDGNLQCTPMITAADIVASVQTPPDHDDEQDDIGDPVPRVSYQTATEAYKNIQAYLLRNSDNPESTFRILKDLDIALTKASSNSLSQSVITDFTSS